MSAQTFGQIMSLATVQVPGRVAAIALAVVSEALERPVASSKIAIRLTGMSAPRPAKPLGTVPRRVHTSHML